MLLVLIAQPVEGQEWEYQEEHVIPFAAHFPRGDLCGVCLSVPIVRSAMEPVAIVVNMKFLEITEFVERVML